jgi:hypothetical protein
MMLGTKGSKWEIPWQMSASKVVWGTEKLRYATFLKLEKIDRRAAFLALVH